MLESFAASLLPPVMSWEGQRCSGCRESIVCSTFCGARFLRVSVLITCLDLEKPRLAGIYTETRLPTCLDIHFGSVF